MTLHLDSVTSVGDLGKRMVDSVRNHKETEPLREKVSCSRSHRSNPGLLAPKPSLHKLPSILNLLESKDCLANLYLIMYSKNIK